MKKNIIFLLLVASLVGCKNELSQFSKKETAVKTSTTEVNEVKQVPKEVNQTELNSIFDEKSSKLLNELKNRLNILYTFSTEMRYTFDFEKIPLIILENNNYIFTTYSTYNLYSVARIDLNTLNTYIVFGETSSGREMELEYSEYKKLIEKLIEIREATSYFNSTREMEVVIYENFPVNISEEKVDIKVVLEKIDENKEIIFRDSKNKNDIFILPLNECELIEKSNNSKRLSTIVSDYSPRLLTDIINLGEKYKKLDFLIKNSNEISTYAKNNMEKDEPYINLIDFNRIRDFFTNVTYYSNGRVESIDGIYFSNTNITSDIIKDLDKLQEDIKNIIFLDFIYYNEFISDIIYSIYCEELNLNKTPQNEEDLKTIKEKATLVFQELDTKIAELKSEKKVEISPGVYAIYYPSGRIKVYSNEYLGDNTYEDAPINFEQLNQQLQEIEETINVNIENQTFNHIWQLNEGLIPYLTGLTYSNNLTDEERENIQKIQLKIDELNEKYKKAYSN